MSDKNQQALPFFTRYLEEQFCEDLSVEEMNAVQGGLTKIAPVDLGDEIPIHPRPLPRPLPRPIGHPIPRPLPHPIGHPIFTSKITDLYAADTTMYSFEGGDS
jgi:hypothetical protein